MIWTVRHNWSSGLKLALNCYRREVLIVVRRPTELCHIMKRREGVTQGHPLSMILYGLALLPLDEAMMAADLGVLQPWYSKVVATRDAARRNAKLLRALMGKVPYRGYFPEPEKSWHILGTCMFMGGVMNPLL